VYSEEGHYLL